MRAVGLLALPLLAALALVVVPITSLFAEQGERLDFAKVRLSAFEKRHAEIPDIERRLAALEEQPPSMQGLLVDNSASLASASIQGRVRPVLASHGAELRSIQNLPPTLEEHFERIPVQYVMSLPAPSLRDFLYDLETSSPYLFIEELSIRAAEQRMPSSAGSSPIPLEVRMTISGYRWVGQNE